MEGIIAVAIGENVCPPSATCWTTRLWVLAGWSPPVALGDRAGRVDAALTMRTCRPRHGVLVKPHTPIAAIDESMPSRPRRRPGAPRRRVRLRHPAGTWTYVVVLHAHPEPSPSTP